MFRFLGKLIGLVEDEYQHIVSDFTSVVARLETLAQRKRDEAVDAAKQASTTAQKIKTLLA